MNSKFKKGLCVILVAALFISTGVVLKFFSQGGTDKDLATDEELEELQEALNEKYEELELTVDYLEEGIKNGIVVAKEKFKGKIDAFKQKKLARKIAKKQEQLDKAENEEKIEESSYDGPVLDMDMLAGISAWDEFLE